MMIRYIKIFFFGVLFPLILTSSTDTTYLLSENERLQQSESLLRIELEQLRRSRMMEDSLKRITIKREIDSLRSTLKPAYAIVENDTLFTLYTSLSGEGATTRIEKFNSTLVDIANDLTFNKDSIVINHHSITSDIHYREKVLLSLSDQDAMVANIERRQMAEQILGEIKTKAIDLNGDYGLWATLLRVLIFIAIILVQILLFKLVAILFRRLRQSIGRLRYNKLKAVYLKDYEFLSIKRELRILFLLSRVLQFSANLLQLTITVPLLFLIFPQTKFLALSIFSYFIDPVKKYALGLIAYLPDLITIIVTYLIVRYIVRGVRFFSQEIENGKLRITGFYPDWAEPTYKIIRTLLYLFMLTIIYPLLPGAQSEIFKGVSVFVGLMVSLGSTSLIGNIGAGILITYMRPFKIGDRIKLNETIGNVIEKTMFVTRIRTPKNEIITLPNSLILTSQSVNYTASAQTYGLIIHSTVTIGYDAPWRQVHQLLTQAALRTEGVLSTPTPFVLETELNDFYVSYQINVYIQDVNAMAQIASSLHTNIQDTFNRAGVEIMSPHYRANRNGDTTTIPSNEYTDLETTINTTNE